MHIACIQYTPVFGEPEQNRAALSRLVGAAEAQLIVLPELCISGYCFADRAEAAALSEPADGPTASALAALCRKRACHVVAGIAEQEGAALYNSAIVVGPDGLLGVYRKTHLFWDEPDWAEPGDSGFLVWDIGPCKLGVLICFDYAFPEAARTLALAGAEVIAHPSNLVLPLCQRVMPVRALENRLFTVTTNRCGTEERAGRSLTFTGLSQVAGPSGDVLAEAPADRDHVLEVEVDLSQARDKTLTPRNHIFDDRRPELYRS